MNILITGTSRGIGRYLAEYYANKGHNIIGCSRSESNFSHALYKHYTLDITDENAVSNLVSRIKKEYNSLDALINNAGIASMNHFLLTTLDKAKDVMNTNFFAPFIFIRACINLLKKSKNPRIINFSTVAVPLNLDGELAYVASKSAVEAMTKILAKELASFKITVNAIAPTPIKTALIKNVPEDKIEELIKKQAIKRFGEYKDISNVIDFYLQEESDFISGQILYLGGITD